MNKFSEFLNRNFYLVLVVILVLIIGLGIFINELGAVQGFLLATFGALTAISFRHLMLLVTNGDSFGIESSLPSIDGSEGGWKFTSSLTTLIITCVFAVPTAMIPFYKSGSDRPKTEEAAKTQKVAANLMKSDSLKQSKKDSVGVKIDSSKVSKAKSDSMKRK